MKYDVHVYATVRVKFEGVEADTQPLAVKQAVAEYQRRYGGGVVMGEDAEEITAALVDEVGDGEYRNSATYDADGNADERGHRNAISMLNTRSGPGGFPLTDLENQLVEECEKLIAAGKRIMAGDYSDPAQADRDGEAFGEVEDFIENNCQGEE